MRELGYRLKKIILLALGLWVITMQGVFAFEPEIKLNHLLLEPGQEGKLHVTEQYRVFNPGESVILEGGISFPLPQGAENIHYGSGVEEDKTFAQGESLVFNQELPPGETTLVFHYLFDSPGEDHFHWDREFNHDIPTFFIIVPAGILQLTGDGLHDQGITSMGGRQLHIYDGSFKKGDKLSLVVHLGSGAFQTGGMGENLGFSDRNIAPPLHSKTHVDRWNASPLRNIEPHLFMLVVVGVPLGLLGRYLFKRGQLSEQRGFKETNSTKLDELKIKEKLLKQKLIKLEQNFAEGIVEQTEYEERLTFYKKKLIEVRLKIKETQK